MSFEVLRILKVDHVQCLEIIMSLLKKERGSLLYHLKNLAGTAGVTENVKPQSN